MKVVWKRSLALTVAFFVLVGLLAFFPFGRKTVAAEASRFCGYGEQAAYASLESELINYTRKEETYIETAGGAPLYYQTSDYPNSCGAVGGAMIVGFYDRYYTDLIPDYDPMTPKGTYKRTDRVYVPQLIGELYTLMRTNVDDVGVSQADCLSGLSTYISNHGRTMSYSSVRNSNSSINQTSFLNAINANKPALLFCSKMDIHYLSYGNNVDGVGKTTFNGAHIAIAYGYFEIKYYNESGLFRTDKYLQVGTGIAGTLDGYLKLEATDWCNAAYAITVT